MLGGSTVSAWELVGCMSGGTPNHGHDAALLCCGAVTAIMLIYLLGFAGLHISLLFIELNCAEQPSIILGFSLH